MNNDSAQENLLDFDKGCPDDGANVTVPPERPQRLALAQIPARSVLHPLNDAVWGGVGGHRMRARRRRPNPRGAQPRAAGERLSVVPSELRRLVHEAPGQSLQRTASVQAAFNRRLAVFGSFGSLPRERRIEGVNPDRRRSPHVG
jgi:hypothetical protein